MSKAIWRMLTAMTERLKPFRFGIGSAPAVTPQELIGYAQRAEEAGFAVFTVPDHISTYYGPLACAMAVLAATERLRVQTRVLANDFRNPVVLAEELASIDALSGGRLEIGIGAGWKRDDYVTAGLEFDRAGVRIARLEEAIAVIKGFMAEGPFSFAGTYYTVTELEGVPKPAQRPHPPILIGGGGQRILELAGRVCDAIGVNLNLSGGHEVTEAAAHISATAFERKLEWVRAAAGSRFDQIELQTHLFELCPSDDREQTAAEIAGRWGVTLADALDSPYFLFGTVDEMCDQLGARRERFGVSMFTAPVTRFEAFAPVLASLDD